MIVGERKPFAELKDLIGPAQRILIVGCGTCVAVCLAGGEKEVGILATQLRLDARREGRKVEIQETTVERQCDREFLIPLAGKVAEAEVVVSLACGAGVQFLAERYETRIVLPGLNTRFLGVTEREGVWSERCRACSACILAETGGVCPITLCAKGLLNGPCSGTHHGKCEVDPEKDCAWTLIYRRLEKTGRLENIRRIFPPREFNRDLHPARQIHAAYVRDEDVHE